METDSVQAGAAPEKSTRISLITLRALQIGAVAAVLLTTTYKSFELDRFFIPKEFVLHATALVAGVSALGAVRRLHATRADALLLGFLVLSAASALLATNGWLAARALTISVSGVVVFWAARCVRQADLGGRLIVAIALAVTLAAVTSLLQAYGLDTDFFSINRSPGGTLGNRNFIGHLAAFGFPILVLCTFLVRRPSGFLLGALGLALTSGTLILTRSRAAWLGIMAALAVLALGGAFAPPVRKSGKVIMRTALLLVCMAGGVAAAVYLPNTLRWTSDSPYEETARGVVNYRDGSGQGRLIQYRTSLILAIKNPPLGVGPGNWSVEYPEIAADNDPSRDPSEPGMTSNPWPSSDWVAMIAERGFLGLLLLVLALVDMAVSAWQRLRTSPDANEALPLVALLAMLAGLAVVGAFDAVLLLAWPTLIFWAAAGILWSPEAPQEVRVSPRGYAFILLLLCMLSGVGAIRSAGQIGAMALYEADKSRAALELASKLDPGNYRVQMRLARRSSRSREERCEHALAARDLFPQAAEARRLARRCE